MDGAAPQWTPTLLPEGAAQYRFEGLTLDLLAWELRANGSVLELPRRSVEILAYLIRCRERVVTRQELLVALWPGVHVGAGSLTQAVWLLRRALAGHSANPRLIKTVHARGYRFTGRLDPDLPGDPIAATLGGKLDC